MRTVQEQNFQCLLTKPQWSQKQSSQDFRHFWFTRIKTLWSKLILKPTLVDLRWPFSFFFFSSSISQVWSEWWMLHCAAGGSHWVKLGRCCHILPSPTLWDSRVAAAGEKRLVNVVRSRDVSATIVWCGTRALNHTATLLSQKAFIYALNDLHQVLQCAAGIAQSWRKWTMAIGPRELITHPYYTHTTFEQEASSIAASTPTTENWCPVTPKPNPRRWIQIVKFSSICQYISNTTSTVNCQFLFDPFPLVWRTQNESTTLTSRSGEHPVFSLQTCHWDILLTVSHFLRNFRNRRYCSGRARGSAYKSLLNLHPPHEAWGIGCRNVRTCILALPNAGLGHTQKRRSGWIWLQYCRRKTSSENDWLCKRLATETEGKIQKAIFLLKTGVHYDWSVRM